MEKGEALSLSFLIDTCAISELTKPKPDAGFMGWFEQAEEHNLYLSVVTLGELWKGATKLPESRRREKLMAWIRDDLPKRFKGRALSVGADVAQEWGRISGEAEIRGETLPILDALIGASALVHDLTVVTRNTADIKRTGAKVLNPWSR